MKIINKITGKIWKHLRLLMERINSNHLFFSREKGLHSMAAFFIMRSGYGRNLIQSKSTNKYFILSAFFGFLTFVLFS